MYFSDLLCLEDRECHPLRPQRKRTDPVTAPLCVSQATHSRLDWTKYFSYRKLVDEELQHYSHIEITDGMQEGGSNTSKAWQYWFQYLEKNVWRTGPTEEATTFCATLKSPRILSLGCGYVGNEINIARGLKAPYELVAIDFNEGLFEKARREIHSRGLNIQFSCSDLNYLELQPDSFDVVFALGSLHHVLNLEHLFHQIWKGLRKDGRFIAMDMIGKTRTLFWRENVEFAAKAVKRLPSKYTARATAPDEIIPPYAELQRQAGMEGIRQEEIEEELGNWFSPVKMYKYGAFMRLICLNQILAPALDTDVPEAREILEDLFRLDLEQVREGRLRPTEMYAVLRKRGAVQVAGKHLRSLARSICDKDHRKHIPITIKELMLLTGMLS